MEIWATFKEIQVGRDVFASRPDRHYVDSDSYDALGKAAQSLVYLWVYETFRQNVYGQSQLRPLKFGVFGCISLPEYVRNHITAIDGDLGDLLGDPSGQGRVWRKA